MNSPLEMRPGRSRLTRLATTRLLNGGPEACERVERDAVDAIKKAHWTRAKQLLQLRLRMRLAPTRDERASIERILKLIDEAEENDPRGQSAVAPNLAARHI
jgi:hypothetical protein